MIAKLIGRARSRSMHLCRLFTVLACGISCWLSSCGMMGKSKSVDDPMAGMDAYKAAGGHIGGFEASLQDGVVANASVISSGIAAPEDIVWAPEDENEPMPGFMEDLWKKPENKSWLMSHDEAMRLSRQTGKPTLVWFTDTAHSPLCRKLSEELFSNPGFDGWATKRLVRLRVDLTIPAKERHIDIGARKVAHIKKLKKRYKVIGQPTVLILSPKGAVVARYRGYKAGSSDYYWGRIKRDVNKAEDDYGAWCEKMEKRGYRLWTSRDGRKTFAKLNRYQPGKIELIDPDGNRGVTSFRKLSDADQAWVMLEKKKYEARRKP